MNRWHCRRTKETHDRPIATRASDVDSLGERENEMLGDVELAWKYASVLS